MPIIRNETQYWAHVDQTMIPRGCWPWMGPWVWEKERPTYGIAIWEGHHVRAHRLALLFTAGEPPPGKPWALHDCNNPPCCNPAHLRWGSPQENSDQMWSSGRGRPHPTQGTFNGHARLTNRQVREIRALYPSLPQTALAEMFNVSQSAISAIVRKASWSHLP